MTALTIAAGAAPPVARPVAVEPPWVVAYALFGAPKYPPTFENFDYVNPDAPKGGTLYLANPDRRTSFDKFNPWTTKGDAPAGVSMLMFETLAFQTADEPETLYGLIGQSFQVAPDLSYVNVRLNRNARFYNGDPVTAEDVKYSLDCMAGPHASPAYSQQYATIASPQIIDPRTLHFDLKEKTVDTLFVLLTSLPIFSHKWGLLPDGSHKDFDQLVTEYPITSGPYTIALTDSGRRIEFARDPNYWARDLPVRRGWFNFDRVVYRLYQDQDIELEAFKAGDFDLNVEYSARRWARSYNGKKFADGLIIKRAFPQQMSEGYASYSLNLRRPLFADIRVREALNYSYDFSEFDRMTYHQYLRTNSLFSNSVYAASGLPSEGELKLLEPYRSQLDPAVFGPPFVNPDAGERSSKLRANLLKARDLLAEAGWKIAADGVLRNAKGEAFEFEYLNPESGSSSAIAVWQRNLQKLGIKLNIREVDFALFIKRLEVYDFDMTSITGSPSALPSAQTLTQGYGSKAADTPGASNYMGIKNPIIDALIVQVGAAKSYQELRDAARALDRVFMWGRYGIPYLYSGSERAAYWNKFGIPATLPSDYTILMTPDASNLTNWPVQTWWIKDPAQRTPH